jgi:hypothetical protein
MFILSVMRTVQNFIPMTALLEMPNFLLLVRTSDHLFYAFRDCLQFFMVYMFFVLSPSLAFFQCLIISSSLG